MNNNTAITIAVVGDIHGNHTALECFVDSIQKKNIDAIFFLGDYITDFPYPRKTMELLNIISEEYPCIFIKGNREEYMLSAQNEHAFIPGSSSGSFLYTFENLDDDHFLFFSNMPSLVKLDFFNNKFGRLFNNASEQELQFCSFQQLFLCSGKVAVSKMERLIQLDLKGVPSLTLCHAGPESMKELLYPCCEATERHLSRLSTDCLLCAHTHIQGSSSGFGKRYFNPGALGSQDTADFMLLYSDAGGWKEEYYHLNYPKNELIKEFEESGLKNLSPVWSKAMIVELETGIKTAFPCVNLAASLYRTAYKEQAVGEIPEIFWEEAAKKMNF